MNRKMKDQREIDWEQRRYEVAREAMSAIISNPNWEEVKCDWVAEMAVMCADALIAELKKGEAR